MSFNRSQIIYAVKLFLSAMLAFSVAESLGQLNPYWAMVTCCVLSNPVSGALRARSVYRFCGTLFAGVVTLTLAAVFINIPMLLVAASGLIAAIMLSLSFLDRTPRSYFFQLSAVTLMLVAIAYLNQPGNMFNIVVNRLTEICIGIISVGFIDSLLFPSSQAASLRQRLKGWLTDIERWQEDSINGELIAAKADKDRMATLNDIASMSQLVTTLKYDRDVDKPTRQAAVAIQQRLLKLVPLLATISSSIGNMTPELKATLSPYLDEVRRQAGEGQNTPANATVMLPDSARLSHWDSLVVNDLVEHINDWLPLWAEIQHFDRFIDGEAQLQPELRDQMMAAKPFKPPLEWDLAFQMFTGIAATYISLCALWYITGWQQGANMVLLGIIGIGFFGNTDDPGKTIGNFGRFAFISMIIGAVLSYALLPLASDYLGFLVVMALFFLPLGLWVTRNPLATLVLALALSGVNFQGHYVPYDVGFYLESVVGTLVGVYVAFLCSALSRNWGTQQVVKRLERHEARDLSRLGHLSSEARIDGFQATALDRIAAQGSRLTALGKQHESQQLLHRLSTLTGLARLRKLAGGNRDSALMRLIDSLSQSHQSPSDEALQQLDLCLEQAWHREEFGILRLLTQLRLGLFPAAPAWSPVHDR
ncbi:FUSC family protein [Marinobacterium lutimaris]|uniref:Uncharacterized membrane protein YccC n=1 Tax=Marinobacterium lutimaris TaxID=568106 RepID=A0A1H5VQZ9_9GAMM|nr:FUSC family protein [Marinobacterium lutimaris]SEF88957.1 Uncharacterized membrane protein YccC [Marinobacterium lutimaris]